MEYIKEDFKKFLVIIFPNQVGYRRSLDGGKLSINFLAGKNIAENILVQLLHITIAVKDSLEHLAEQISEEKRR